MSRCNRGAAAEVDAIGKQQLKWTQSAAAEASEAGKAACNN